MTIICSVIPFLIHIYELLPLVNLRSNSRTLEAVGEVEGKEEEEKLTGWERRKEGGSMPPSSPPDGRATAAAESQERERESSGTRFFSGVPFGRSGGIGSTGRVERILSRVVPRGLRGIGRECSPSRA